MSEIPVELRYSEEHEYVKLSDEPDIVTVGITDYAQGELGDIVYVELPSAGTQFSKMDVFGTIEAVKAVSELYAPATGEIVEVNSALEDDPSVINNDPYGAGWMVKLRVADAAETEQLLSAADYAQHIGE
jgi:glycine cleavage system H protein